VAIVGIFGKPYIDLEPLLDLSALPAIHEEICLGLAQVPVEYTGGSHRSMGIMPPSRAREAYGDYGEVIRGMSREEFVRFVALAEEPGRFDPERRHEYRFGEEQDHLLSRKQMRYLSYRYGVYFPWKVYYEMIPNLYWDEKSSSEGKSFTRQARMFFPRTVAFVQGLPFQEIGRCNIMGLEPNDHGTVHRDGDPAVKTEVDHFITFCPGGDKRLFLWCEEAREELPIDRRAYWFNDSDYHGVEAAPRFRYSVRVDGVFEEDFVEKIRSSC
jgi:hypothetical protein